MNCPPKRCPSSFLFCLFRHICICIQIISIYHTGHKCFYTCSDQTISGILIGIVINFFLSIQKICFELGKELRKMFFVLSRAWDKEKITISTISIYKLYAIDIARSMQDACHMNFVIDLAQRRVSVAQWQSIGARNPKV